MPDDPKASTLPEHPLVAHEAVATVLLDRVQLGFELPLPTVCTRDARRFCNRLASLGVLSGRAPSGSVLGRPLPIGFSGVPLDQGGRGQVGGRLALACPAGTLVATSRSWLVLNPLRDLRTQLFQPGQVATDGNDNVVWEFGEEWHYLLGWQVANVTAVVDAFLASVAAAAEVEPSLLRGRVWVQQCEVCRDHGVPDAEALVREMRDHPIPGGVASIRTVARRRRNLVCVAWKESAKSAPERKVYAKRTDLLRLEITLRNREAVRALLAGCENAATMSDDVSGASAGRQLADVARACAPLLDQVERVVRQRVDVRERNGIELLLGFGPLTRLAAPALRLPGAGGRPPDASLPERARSALVELLASGTFDAYGLGASDAVLLALRDMAAAGTLAAPLRGRRVFAVAPGLNEARLALSRARRTAEDG